VLLHFLELNNNDDDDDLDYHVQDNIE